MCGPDAFGSISGVAGAEPVPGQSMRTATSWAWPAGIFTAPATSPARSPYRKAGQNRVSRSRPGPATAYRSVGGVSPPCHSWVSLTVTSFAERLRIVTGSDRPRGSRATRAPGTGSTFSAEAATFRGRSTHFHSVAAGGGFGRRFSTRTTPEPAGCAGKPWG